MDKNAIKKFAIWARRDLIERVTQRAMKYGIVAHEPVDPNADSANGYLFSPVEKHQRQTLISKIQEKGFEQVIEEVAYTWFNRFAALRFMEVNDYLPSHIRVFTNEAGEFKPQILSEAIHLDIQGLDLKKVYELESANKKDELYKYLLIVQCNALNSILPRMFQKIEDYTELLLPDNLLREGSVLEQIVTAISEDDWKDQVQIIGWLYQYYNTEPKDKVFADLKKNIKISKENIPAATQLFTPDWIVHYMVENSLGRLWLEGHPNDTLKSNWKYYLDEAEQEVDVQAQLDKIREEYANLKPEEIRVIDPCMGSGHILCVLFDVLVQIYTDYGYSEKEAVTSIIEKNLFGLDIDERATQLAYFAVMMKARQYDRRFFSRNLQPHVYAICESNSIRQEVIDYFCSSKSFQGEALDISIKRLLNQTKDATEYGSLIIISDIDFDLLYQRIEEIKNDDSFYRLDVINQLLPLIEVAQVLAQKYHVVVTNPPYMGANGIDNKLTKYIKDNYPDSKSDLFSVFIERCGQLAKKNGYYGMITQPSILFLTSFTKLRKKIIENQIITSLLHMGRGVFGIDFGSTTFVIKNNVLGSYKGIYFRLHERTFQYIEPGDIANLYIKAKNDHNFKFDFANYKSFSEDINDNIELVEQNIERKHCSALRIYFEVSQNRFLIIPGKPIAYWLSDKFIEIFNNQKLGEISRPRIGQNTGDNNRFLRLWFENDYHLISFNLSHDELTQKNYKWIPYNKGGEYRRWYGNQDYTVNWANDGKEIKDFAVIRNHGKHWSRYIQNVENMCKEGITWSFVTSGKFAVRYLPVGFICDVAGSAIFPNKEDIFFVIGLLNSSFANYILKVLNPTINYQAGNIASIPVKIENKELINGFVRQNITLSKSDWDSFETSWDFVRHPLVKLRTENGELKTENGELRTENWIATASTKPRNDGNNYGSNTLSLNNGSSSSVTLSAFKQATSPQGEALENIYQQWSQICTERFNQLKSNEEELNRIFIDIYGLNDELTLEVEDKDVTVRKADLQREIRSFISYAVGCMMGRYSLDCDGLAFAGGEWDKSKYTSFIPDEDGIIPITDDEYFNDDIVGRFIDFIKIVYGEDTLEDNLKFIADAIGGKGSARQVIRNYFISEFYADHVKVYQKRPIYWLFDSGKKNGFKCLIYMHRYQPDTLARIRTDYIHEQQARYRTTIADLEQRINSASTSERVKLNKQLAKIKDQAEEIRLYEEKIHHLADQMIKIDLDDGVKHNYAIFESVLAKIK